MSATVVGTKVTVRDPQSVEEVLDSNVWQGLDITLNEEGGVYVLVIQGEEDSGIDDAGFPQAVKRELVPEESPDPENDDEEWYDEMDKVYEEHGDAGFLELLRELSPYIEQPLVVLAAAMVGIDYWAQAWCVLPGSKEITTITT